MKITLEVNDTVALKLKEWGRENFSSTKVEDVIQELVLNMLIHYEDNPEDYHVSDPPAGFCYLFSPSAEFDENGIARF